VLRTQFIMRRMEMVEARIHMFEIHAGLTQDQAQLGHHRDIRVEQVIEALMRLDADGLEEQFGTDFTRRVARVTMLASLPFLRRLPLLRDVARAREQAQDESDLLTRSAHALGRGMERTLSTMYWLADLYGVISASLMVDRLGAMIAKATQRPAKRLLILGLLVALLTGLVQVVAWGQLITLLGTVRKFVGLPIIVLGIVCFVAMVLGRWFQRVAGQAGDFYARAAEAQFLGLIKLVKRTGMEDHGKLLERRILSPEARVTGRRRPGTQVARKMHFAERMAAVLDEDGKVEPGGAAERVALLYRHYLDGAPLHRSGSTTTNQLLGNLVLDNVLKERLQLKRKQLKSLAKLDLERSRSILGPYLWFNFITLAVAQRTARLVVEFNIHSVAQDERELYDPEELAAVDAWLEARRNGGRSGRAQKLDKLYRTTAFTAVDFLTRDPERDQMIAEKFGEGLGQQTQLERRRMIREVFGTYPFSSWPKADRSINLYDLYWRYLGGARALLFPLVMGWKLLLLLLYLLRRLLGVLGDLLNPTAGMGARDLASSSYAVALRKINRMRKPVFMAATQLRARFDVEYMNLSLPGMSSSGLEHHTFEEDLRFIGALEEELDWYMQTKREHRLALQTLAEFLRAENWEGDGLERWLEARSPGLGRRAREALRASAIAFGIDYQSVSTLTQLELSIRAGMAQAVMFSGTPPQARMQLIRGRLIRGLLIWTPRSFIRRRAFDRYWAANCGDQPERERQFCRKYALADPRGLGHDLMQARRHGNAPMQQVRQIVQRICKNPTTWTQQLLTIRAVQSLAMLDVLSDRQIVRDLGEYQDAPQPPQPVVLPRL